MALSREEIEHVAALAHIELRPEEIDVLSVQLSSVVEHISKLAELDTEDVAPTAQAVSAENVMREDEVRPSWTPEAVLANAPRRRDDLFEVQAVLD